MQVRYFLIALAFCIAGCGGNSTKQTTAGTADTLADGTVVQRNTEEQRNTEDQSNGFWEKLVMVEIKDRNGAIAAIRPFPSSWKIGNSLTTGPYGISIKSFPLRTFMDNYNPSLQQSYIQSGQQLRSMPGVEQLIQEDFVPWARDQGMELVNYFEIPEISKMDKWYSESLFAAMPARSDVAAFGINWKRNDGTPYFQILHLTVKTSNTMQNWSYYVDGLEADADHMETAKKQLIFGLANTRYNLEPIMAFNKEEAQRCNQSWAAFNQRMAQNQANFEAQQRAFVNRSEAVNDAIMSGYRARNAASDRNQENTIDGIYERTNVQNTETGEQYKVSAGANQYWMNNNGEYISTRINDYNPNLDQNMNEQKWQQLKEIKKN
ncbi:MAG: hypothetical protein ABIO79_01380 [Ferruginibacter sp.]